MRRIKRWTIYLCYYGIMTMTNILKIGSIILFVMALIYYLCIQADRITMQMVPCEIINYGTECYLLTGQVFVCQMNETNCQYVSECSCALSYESALHCLKEVFPIGSEYECFLMKNRLYLTEPAASLGFRMLIFTSLLLCTVIACSKNKCFHDRDL